MIYTVHTQTVTRDYASHYIRSGIGKHPVGWHLVAAGRLAVLAGETRTVRPLCLRACLLRGVCVHLYIGFVAALYVSLHLYLSLGVLWPAQSSCVDNCTALQSSFVHSVPLHSRTPRISVRPMCARASCVHEFRISARSIPHGDPYQLASVSACMLHLLSWGVTVHAVFTRLSRDVSVHTGALCLRLLVCRYTGTALPRPPSTWQPF